MSDQVYVVGDLVRVSSPGGLDFVGEIVETSNKIAFVRRDGNTDRGLDYCCYTSWLTPIAREMRVKVDCDMPAIQKIVNEGIARHHAAEAPFLAAVDGLLRYAQGLTDRDSERERLCRALAPMLRERMGCASG